MIDIGGASSSSLQFYDPSKAITPPSPAQQPTEGTTTPGGTGLRAAQQGNMASSPPGSNRPPAWLQSKLPSLPDESLDHEGKSAVRRVHSQLDPRSLNFMCPWKFSRASDFSGMLSKLPGYEPLDKIRVLTLQGKSFTKEHLQHLSRFSNLEELHLYNCFGCDVTECAVSIARCEKLKRLSVKRCNFSDADAFLKQLFPDPEKNNKVLEELDFSSNGPLASSSGAILARFEALQILHLEDCGLTRSFLEEFLPHPNTNHVLELLDLSRNRQLFSGGTSAILARFKALQMLNIAGCM